ncbi:MAG TPA: hypothetical protein VHI52_13395 [Verrucomicrobiae bacterium]|nr:hypothetical protein [Verrucomicrobiae bacterium]
MPPQKCLILVSCLWLFACGCHMHTSQPARFANLQSRPNPAPHHRNAAAPEPLPGKDLRELVKAANDFAMFGTPIPEDLTRRLKPVEVYYDLANVVFALSRDAHEETGYYVVTPISSFLPAGEARGFRWQQLDVSAVPGVYSGIYLYHRNR